jgi:spore coat assembly protein
MKQGDLVVRKSYGGDVLFRIEQLFHRHAVLKGVQYRLLADAPLEDLNRLNHPEQYPKWTETRSMAAEKTRTVEKYCKRVRTKQSERKAMRNGVSPPFFEMPGKVLHIDGDQDYLRKSMSLYHRFRIPAQGFFIRELHMPDLLMRLLPQVKPDIVVITGHDGVLKHRSGSELFQLSSYKNSIHFVNAVHVARQFERDRDSLTVIAGACQSHFEALLQAGANFASSPARILIHALDPVLIAIKSSLTPIRETINVSDVIRHTISGMEGIGGIETQGCYRIGMPNLHKFLSTGPDTPEET